MFRGSAWRTHNPPLHHNVLSLHLHKTVNSNGVITCHSFSRKIIYICIYIFHLLMTFRLKIIIQDGRGSGRRCKNSWTGTKKEKKTKACDPTWHGYGSVLSSVAQKSELMERPVLQPDWVKKGCMGTVLNGHISVQWSSPYEKKRERKKTEKRRPTLKIWTVNWTDVMHNLVWLPSSSSSGFYNHIFLQPEPDILKSSYVHASSLSITVHSSTPLQ